MKNTHIIGSYAGTPFAVASPDYESAALKIHQMVPGSFLHLIRTEKGEDFEALIDILVEDPNTRMIVITAAVEGLTLRQGLLGNPPPNKILSKIRKERKDIYLVATHKTIGATPQEQYVSGLQLLKSNSANLVLANDALTLRNIVVTPEESWYGDGSLEDALGWLVKIIGSRVKNTFTRSTVLDGPRVPWQDPEVPAALRAVVDHLVAAGAYKPFLGKTAGHFAVKLAEDTFLTSARKTDFNFDLQEKGLVKVISNGQDSVTAYGARPSVGGQSQRIIFREHPEFDCIAHAHVPLLVPGSVNTVPQWPRECGSHQCGAATSAGLREVAPGIKAVYLENHGPNIVFRRDVDPARVIQYMEDHFSLSEKTGGLVS